MFVDAPSIPVADQTSMRMGAINRNWSSEAYAPISERIGDYYRQDITQTSFISKRSAILVVNSNTVIIGQNQHSLYLFSGTAANDIPLVDAAPLPFSDRLETVQKRLGLSITQVAELLGVTRKSVYDWFDGKSSPRASAIQKVEALNDIINESPTGIDITRLKTVWNIPTDGESFLNLLKDEAIPVDLLKEKALAKLLALGPRLGKADLTPGKVRQPLSTLIDIDRSIDV
jgi:transcriptional regulator with XRE-family HTH domain